MDFGLVVGTAGHIDHGKTTLVRALTGHDLDTLPEEKDRGITIALGFAPLELDAMRVGIVDVPGHERLVRTMIAGVARSCCACRPSTERCPRPGNTWPSWACWG